MKHIMNKKNIAFAALLAIIVLTGFYYRILLVNNVHFTDLHQGTEFFHDEFNYVKMAEDLLRTGVYGYLSNGEPNAYVTPGYPLFLALIFSIFGFGVKSVLYVKYVQSVLSVLSIILVYLIGNKIANRYVGIFAAVLTAFYPPLVLYCRYLFTETLYIFLFLLYFLIQLIAIDKESLRLHFLSGFLIAAAILVRPLIFILAPLPYIYKYFTVKENKKAVLKQFSVFLSGFVLLMLPWWIRNIVTMHRFIFLCTQSNPFYYGILEDYNLLPPSDNETTDGIKLIIHNLITHPLATIKWYTIGKINIIFGKQDYYLPDDMGYMRSAFLLHYFIIICGAIGTVIALYIKEIRLISMFLVLNILFQLAFIPVARYSIPLIPLLSVIGAYMLWFLIKQCKEYKIRGE